MKHFFIWILSVLFWQVSAQKIVVVDKTSAEPVIGVAVFNLFKTKTNISNFDGQISISKFQSFEKVYFQHLAFHKEVVLKSKLGDTIFLTPKSLDLKEVVISASKFEQNRKEVPQKL
jgi:hemoglobin/transferrin/lactoferrin receptor protein